MKSINVQLEYDESVLLDGREVEIKLKERLYGTGFKFISLSHESSKMERDNPPVKDDKDSTGAGGQTSPDNEKPPNTN
jgi:hypothetical protein